MSFISKSGFVSACDSGGRRWLAEEMVLYYHGPQEKQTFEEK